MTSIKPVLEKQTIKRRGGECSVNCEIGVLFTTWLDGDVPNEVYSVDTTAVNNFIHFTSYNSQKAEVEGIFNVILTRDGNHPPPNSIVFSNGKFTVKVKREWFE